MKIYKQNKGCKFELSVEMPSWNSVHQEWHDVLTLRQCVFFTFLIKPRGFLLRLFLQIKHSSIVGFLRTESYLSIMSFLRKPPQNCGQWNSNFSSNRFLVHRGRVWIKLELGDENLQLCWGYGRFRTPRSNVALITHDWWFCRGPREYNGVILFSRVYNTKWSSLTLKEEFKQHKYW